MARSVRPRGFAGVGAGGETKVLRSDSNLRSSERRIRAYRGEDLGSMHLTAAEQIARVGWRRHASGLGPGRWSKCLSPVGDRSCLHDGKPDRLRTPTAARLQHPNEGGKALACEEYRPRRRTFERAATTAAVRWRPGTSTGRSAVVTPVHTQREGSGEPTSAKSMFRRCLLRAGIGGDPDGLDLVEIGVGVGEWSGGGVRQNSMNILTEDPRNDG